MTARRRADDAGFTVVEMVVTCGILSLVLATLLSVLNAQTNASIRIHAVVNSQEDVRFAMTTMARDLRAAEPIVALATAADYANQIQVQLKDGTGASLGYVRWILDPTAKTVQRQTLSGPNGTVTGTTLTLPRVRNADASIPVFRYYDSSGTQLTAGVATAADFANCTIRVHLSLQADTNPGPLPFLLETDAEVRNRLPGGIGC
jgi:type II secretory pathway pseudopilin PulG